jgi:hypothetical protein
MSLLKYKIFPDSKLSINPSIFNKVVLPDPDGPVIAKKSPLFIVNEKFESTLISISPCE